MNIQDIVKTIPHPLIPNGSSGVTIKLWEGDVLLVKVRAVRKLLGKYLSRPNGYSVTGSRVEWWVLKPDGEQVEAGVCYGETSLDFARAEIVDSVRCYLELPPSDRA